mgnify:CR=1 FL=1
MAINLGNIRSAGFRKGLATGFIKSEAAKADAERREKEYQQLLAREKANREFQASQSLLNRDARSEESRLSREQTQQNADRTFDRSVLNYNKTQAALKKKEKTEAIKNAKSAVQSRINALGPALNKSHISSLQKLYSDLPKEDIESLVNYTMLGTKDKLSRDEEKVLFKADDDILKDLNGGNIRGEAAIATMLNSRFIKRMQDRGIFKTESTQAKLVQRYSSIYKQKVAASISIDTKSTSYNIGDKDYVIPSNTTFMSQLKQVGEYGRLSLFSGRLKQWNSLFQNALDDKKKPSEIVNSKAYKSFISQKDLLQSKNKNNQNIYSLGNYKALTKLLNIDPTVTTPKATAPTPIKRKAGETQLSTQTTDDFELQVFSRDGDELTPASSLLVASNMQGGVDLSKLGGMHPADISTDRNLENYSQLRKTKEAKSLMAAWKEERYREGDALNNLVNFMRTKGGSSKGQEGQDIVEAVLYLEPDNLMVKNKDRNRRFPRPNKIYDAESTKGVTNKIVADAKQQVRGSTEATELITSIQDIVRIIGPNNPLGAGAGLEMFTSDVTSAATGIATFAASKLGAVGGLAKNMLSSIMGSDNTLEQLEQQARANVNSSVGGTAAFKLERQKRTEYFRGLAEEAYKDIDKDLEKKDIDERTASLRKLVVLKKMALTYRLSGLFQGDSSGRTISNQDYDVAASALWGEAYGFEDRMLDLKQFFNARITRFGAVAQFSNDRAVGLADRVTNAVIRQDNSDYIQRIIGKNEDKGMYATGAKPKTTLETAGRQIREKINNVIANDNNLKMYGSTSKLFKSFGNELVEINNTELVPPDTSILNTELPKTSKWVKKVTDVSNLIFQKAYPSQEKFKEAFPSSLVTYDSMQKTFRMSVFQQAYKFFRETKGT